jgi:hypothetical protein
MDEVRNQEEIEKMIEKLREHVLLLKESVEKDKILLGEDWKMADDILCAIDDILSQCPIDAKKLSGTALGIIKIWDGPLYNYLEKELFDLAGDVGLLVRRLRQDS